MEQLAECKWTHGLISLHSQQRKRTNPSSTDTTDSFPSREPFLKNMGIFAAFLLPASDKAVDVWTKWQFSLEKEQDEEVENKFAVSKRLVLKQ